MAAKSRRVAVFIQSGHSKTPYPPLVQDAVCPNALDAAHKSRDT